MPEQSIIPEADELLPVSEDAREAARALTCNGFAGFEEALDAFARFERTLTERQTTAAPETLTGASALEEAALIADDYRENAGGSDSYRMACGHIAAAIRRRVRQSPAVTTEGQSVGEAECDHTWRYTGTDYHGSHKGEDCYECSKCQRWQYRLDDVVIFTSSPTTPDTSSEADRGLADELPSAADPANLSPIHVRLLERGARSRWIGLSDNAGVHVGEVVALGELQRAGLVRPTEDELPPGPPSPRPREITDAGRAALDAYLGRQP